jgi:hypothetical protein
MVAAVLVSGCYGTRFWLFKYLFPVVMFASGFCSSFFWLLQNHFLLLLCYTTHFWLLQYSFLVKQYSSLIVTVLISGGYSTLFWLLWLLFVLVKLLVSGFYSTYFWLVQ